MGVAAGVDLVPTGHLRHAAHVGKLHACAGVVRQRDALLLQLYPQTRQLHGRGRDHQLWPALQAFDAAARVLARRMRYNFSSGHSYNVLWQLLSWPAPPSLAG